MRLSILTLLGCLATLGIAQAQDNAQQPPRDYFIEATLDNPSPFVGEQVRYSFRVFTSISAPAAPQYNPPNFEGFWSAGSLPDSTTQELIDGTLYSVTMRETILFPTRAGELMLEPATLVFPATVFAGEEILSTGPVTVDVRALPEDEPGTFTGAVGEFALEASVNRLTASLGDPLELRVRVIGDGNVQQLLPLPLPIEDDWRVYEQPAIYDEETTGGLLVGEKVFRWFIIPPQAGEQRLPPIALSYFDPDTLTYQTISTEAVTLNILPVESAGGVDLVLPEPGSLGAPALMPIPNVLGRQRLWPIGWFWLLWAVPPSVFVAALWLERWRIRREREKVQLRRERAFRKAKAHLVAASRADRDTAYYELVDAVLNYFGDKFNMSAQAINQAELEDKLLAVGVREDVIADLLDCFAAAEEGRFAPTEASSPRPLVARTLEALAVIDATLW